MQRVATVWSYTKAGFRHLVNITATDALTGLSLGLAVLSLFASMHTDVFEQEENRVGSMVTLPFQRLCNTDLPSTSLQALLPGFSSSTAGLSTDLQPSTESPSPATGSTGPPSPEPPLYIFILDVSKSMERKVASVEEVQLYLDEIGAYSDVEDPLLRNCVVPPEASNGFEIARSELCRYVGSLPDGTHAALWTFGNEATMMVPEDNNSDKYIPIKKNEQGGSTKSLILNRLPALKVSEERLPTTDFATMLARIRARYKVEIDGTQEVHFVIISDFDHDLDNIARPWKSSEARNGTLEDQLRDSRYQANLTNIKNSLVDIAKKKGKMFHFAVVRGAQKVIYSVLPLAEAIEWEDYREIRVEPDQMSGDFDFLRLYEENSPPITFYYTPGRPRPYPLTVNVGEAALEGTKLRISLVTTSASEHNPLGLEVTAPKFGSTVLRPGDASVVPINSKNDRISLEPISVPVPGETGKYRLLLALHKENDENGGRSSNKTFYSNVEFKKRLDSVGALGIAAALIFSVIYLLLLVGAMVRDFRAYRARRRAAEAAGTAAVEG
jgi:hypothetical protein